MSRLAINLIGTFQVRLSERPARFATEKARALLAYLAVEAGRSHRREALSALFWPDQPDSTARANLRQTLHRLRLAIDDVDSPNPHLLVSVHDVQLDPAGDHWLDVAEFERRLAAYRAHCGQGLPLCAHCQEALKTAAALYQGEFMAGFSLPGSPAFELWLLARQERCHRQALELLGRLGSFYEETGAFSQAAGCAQRLVGLEPWRQRFHRLLMRSLAQAGQREAAMAQYARCRQLLSGDLGVEPSEKTRRLYELIRDGDDEALRSRGEKETGGFAAAPERGSFPPFTIRGELTSPQPFVGREDELSKLGAHLSRTLAGQGRVVFISGEAGSGKSTLAAELCRRAMATEEALLVAYGASHTRHGLGDPYQPFRQLLRQLCGQAGNDPGWGAVGERSIRRLRSAHPRIQQALIEIGPDLPGTLLPRNLLRGVRRPTKGNDEKVRAGSGQTSLDQVALFDQVIGVLLAVAQNRPLILVLDDLHWIDDASASLLFHLGRHLAHSPILVIGAFRPEEADWSDRPAPSTSRHPLLPVIAGLQRLSGDIYVDLNQADGRAFVEAFVDSQPNRLGAGFRTSLQLHTGGNPLFTVEILRGLQDRGELVKDEDGRWVIRRELDWDQLPPRVEAVIGERFDRLSDRCRALLTAASVQGQTFLAEVAAEIRTFDAEPAVTCLSEVLGRQHHLVEAGEREWYGEAAVSRYRFRHHLFQHYAYQQLDPVVKSRSHQATGLTLEGLYSGREEEHALELAGHFEAAGMLEKAVEYLLAAGRVAYGLSANESAIDCFGRALDLLRECPPGPKRDRAEMTLHLARTAPLLATRGYTAPEIQEAANRVIYLSEKLDEPDYLFPARLLLVTHYAMLAEYHPAMELAEQLLKQAESDQNPLHLTQAHHFLGYLDFCAGSFEAALCHFDAALTSYDPQVVSRLMSGFIGQNVWLTTLFRKAWTLWFLGYPNQSLAALEETMSKVEQLGQDHDLAFTLAIGICPILYLRREYDRAEVQVKRLLQLASRKGLHYFIPFGKVNLGSVLAKRGRTAEGQNEISTGIRLYREGCQKTFLTFCLSLLIESLGEDEEAGQVLDEALALVEETGERFFEAELWRLRGEFLLKREGDPAESEAYFRQALDIAGQQGAKALQLRAATSLAGLWNRDGKSDQAHDLLVRVYDSFNEGFNTPDLQAAQTLLEELDGNK